MEKSITGGGGGAAEEMGFGDNAFLTDPSSAYFLGLPLFFFSVNGVTPAGGGAAGYDGEVAAIAAIWAVID